MHILARTPTIRRLLGPASLPFSRPITNILARLIPPGLRPVNRGTASRSVIALTFDDGPNAAYTPEILRTLEKHDAKGTFFVTGANAKRHPQVAREIVEHGNQIANHSYSHSESLTFLSPSQIMRDCREAEEVIRESTGLAPRFYRAPYGRLSPWMLWVLRSHGLLLIQWDCSGKDWRNPSADELVHRVTKSARAGGILLFHDGLGLNLNPDRSQLAQALPVIIEQLQARGCQLATVAELLREEPYF